MAAAAKKFTRSQLWINVVLSTLFFSTVTLLLAGDWGWIEGWIVGLWFSAMVVSNMVYLFTRDPELLAERSKAPGSDNQKGWDKYLQSAAYVLAVIWFLIMPLDAKRFGWSPAFPLWLKVLGGLALIPALYLIFRATVDNTYLSAMVRIQDERKQRVVSTGVYSFVRHPLYLGCILMLVGAALLIGSIVGLVLGGIAVVALVVRVLGEEKMLVEELEGYTEYRQKVKYRLFPFIW
jgi:protein-S-isoprenylcysteine O-methyltransferase Ste14